MTTQRKHNAGDLPDCKGISLIVKGSPFCSLCCVAVVLLFRNLSIDTPPTHPHQNKRHSGLRMKMRPNQDVRGNAKKCASSYAMATALEYARVFPEPSAPADDELPDELVLKTPLAQQILLVLTSQGCTLG